MKKQIHSQHWHMLTGQQFVDLFNANFENVTIQPLVLVKRLKMLEVATIECLENRTASTVYRIRQTGEVYQITQPNGELFEYDDYESYQMDDPVDNLVESFLAKEPVHIITQVQDDIYIERLKPPRFRAKYVPGDLLNNLKEIEWIDKEPEFNIYANIMRKAGGFVASYLKNKK